MEWISAKDRIPDSRELCIVCVEICTGKEEVADCMAVFNGYEWQWWVDGLADEIELTVTYWMPIPEPPKEV